MGRKIAGLLVAFIVLFGCKEKSGVSESNSTDTPQKTESFKRAMSAGDYNFQVEYNERLDTSYLDVMYKGKKVKRQGFRGKVSDDFTADLNKDKESELYVVVNGGGKTNIYGYLFEEGEILPIIKEEHRDLSNIMSNTYTSVQNQIVEKYQVKTAEGTVETNESRYNLVKRGEKYMLIPQGWKPEKLAKMTGQYAARGGENSGYYNVMLLTKLRGGEWNVSIKTKRKEDKKILCDFNGIGYFLDKDLIVPMNKVDPNLKGSLKIRFLDLMAAVYTEDSADYKEMTSFCNGKGSIAGNFMKTDI